MFKRRSGAQFLVADGAGGMRALEDLRFEDGEWPVKFRIRAKHAQDWMAYLNAESEARGYSSSSLSQLGAEENSGSTRINLRQGGDAPAFDFVWERRRNRDLMVKARPNGNPTPDLNELRSFLESVASAHSERRLTTRHRRQYLVHRGLPWRGELWLSDQLCLRQGSQPVEYRNDPNIIVVDATVHGIGSKGVNDTFGRLLRELTIFLDVVVGLHAVQQEEKRVWTYEVDEKGHYRNFGLRPSAYYEPELHPRMPTRGESEGLPTYEVDRPGIGDSLQLGLRDRWSVPQDTEALWRQLQALPEALRTQFLQAANAYTIGTSLFRYQRTSAASFLVVACEALKPAGRKFAWANIYDVVAGLAGLEAANSLRQLVLHPQKIRSEHFHRAHVVSDELAPRFGTDYFEDPSFDELVRSLHKICRICLIEWLRHDGQYTLRRVRAKTPWLERLRRAWATLRG